LVESLRFSDQQAGLVASAEMAGIASTAIALTFLAAKLNWRRTLQVCAVVAAISGLAGAFAQDFVAFAATRFAAGIGLGGMISLSWAAVGLTRNPDREFALYVGWVLVYGAVALLALPAAISLVGMAGVVIAMGAFALLGVPLARFMPRSSESRPAPNADAVDIGVVMKLLALGGVLIFNVALGAAWAYLFLIGVAAQIAEQSVTNALALSQIAAVAGAVVVFAVAQRFGRVAPLTACLVGGALSLLPLLGGTSLVVYAISVSAFNFVWNCVMPYIFASVSSFDRTARMVVYAVAAQMVGLGVGPAIAAMIVEPNNFDQVILLAAALILMSWMMLLTASLHHRSRLAGQHQRDEARMTMVP
jgi:predicted MFS family arabinose efflux permease